MWLNSRGGALLREVEDDLLGRVDELGRVAGSFPAEARDLAAGPDQAAKGGGLADDLGVVTSVRRRGDERRELVDALLATGVLELAPLGELVGERDRVDRLALGVQGQRRAVHAGMALAVELPPGRVDHLADRGDRSGREHHRAEDGLLGVEVLGRDVRRLDCGHAAVTIPDMRPGRKDV